VKTLSIAAMSLRRLLRDRTNLFFIFALPMVLIFVFGLVFGNGFTTRVALVVPEGDEAAAQLVDRISASDAYEVVFVDDVDDARARIRRSDIDAAIVIPDGYGADLAAGENVEISYYASPNAGGIQVRSAVGAAVTEQAATVLAARFAADEASVDPTTAHATATVVQGKMAPVDVALEGGTGAAGGAFDTGAAQQLLLFMFITAMASSTALIEARRLGVSRRMLSTPTRPAAIVGGETLGRFLVVLFQGVFVVLAAAVLFGVYWGDPVAASLVVAAFALTGTGAGMLLGSSFSNEQQAGGIAIFAALILAALGGSMVPLEIFPDTMVRIAHLTPHAWGNDAFATLIRHGGGVGDITKELAVLTGYGVVLTAVAAVVFRRRLTH
jgi:ABC-2 type transport system permease protein